jgi:hypothetical protein
LAETLAPGDIAELLIARRFDALTGTAEHEQVECKSAPYRLDDDAQRQELAKDVAGLANANGGVIVIGFRTVRNEDTREDIIRGVSPFDRMLIDTERYHDVLSTWIYPTLDGVQVRWHESVPGRGVMEVLVPPQAGKHELESDRPRYACALLSQGCAGPSDRAWHCRPVSMVLRTFAATQELAR